MNNIYRTFADDARAFLRARVVLIEHNRASKKRRTCGACFDTKMNPRGIGATNRARWNRHQPPEMLTAESFANAYNVLNGFFFVFTISEDQRRNGLWLIET